MSCGEKNPMQRRRHPPLSPLLPLSAFPHIHHERRIPDRRVDRCVRRGARGVGAHVARVRAARVDPPHTWFPPRSGASSFFFPGTRLHRDTEVTPTTAMTTEELGTALAARNERRMLEGAQAAAIPAGLACPCPCRPGRRRSWTTPGVRRGTQGAVLRTERNPQPPRPPRTTPSRHAPSSAPLAAPATPAAPAGKARRATRPRRRRAPGHRAPRARRPGARTCVAPAARGVRAWRSPTRPSHAPSSRSPVAVLVACRRRPSAAVASRPRGAVLPGVPTYRAAHTARAAPSVAIPSTTVVRGASVGRCL